MYIANDQLNESITIYQMYIANDQLNESITIYQEKFKQEHPEVARYAKAAAYLAKHPDDIFPK